MDFTIVTYGAGEILETIFNAIAALINSKTGTLYQPLVRLALIVGLVWATVSMVYGERVQFLNNWVIPFFLALTLFFAPTCKLHIHDPVTGHHYKVDNVPWGLGAVAGIISQIGDKATREIEKTFSLPDDLKYHKTGAVMASNLIASARTFHITNADLSETMRSFVNQCVVYDALLGKKYTLHDLQNAPDIWGLVSNNPSPARSFTFKAPGKGQQAEIVTCAQGAARLDSLFKRDVGNAFQFFEGKVLGKRDTILGPQLRQYLPGAFNYMTKMAKSAEEYMMQQMMIYSVVDSVENQSTALGNAPNFAVRRAYLQQRANQESLAGIAGQKLIAMKNVMEALIYAAFMFILPLAMLPMGWQYIGRWISLVMWVQLWPPLYAILNFIMNVSVRSKGLGIVGNDGITIANSVGFANLHADMAAQAGFMSLAIGSLAYALVKGGAASFVHLASHMASPAVSAASRAAEDLMSGNYSFGNVSQGTVQAHNTSFGQENLSPSYTSGSFTQNDGVISRTTAADGEHVVSVASSNLRSGVNLSESLSNSFTEQATKAEQMSETQMVAAAQAEADHNRQVMDLSEHQAKQMSESESHSSGQTASVNQAFNKVDALVDRFAKDHSVSKEVAQQVMGRASASVSAGVGFQVFGTGASATVSGEVAAQASMSEHDRELFSAAQDYSKQHNFQEAISQASQVARDSRFTEHNDTGQRYTSGISSAYEQSQQYRQEASASLQKSESLSEMASWTKQNAGSINANLNQEYVGWLQNQALPNSTGAMGIREAETIMSSRPDLDHHYQQRFLENKISTTQLGVAPEKAFQQAQDSISPVNRTNSITLGEAFKIDTQKRDDINEKLDFIEDQLVEQKELLERQAKTRRGKE